MKELTPPVRHWKGVFFTVIAGQTVSLIGSAAVQFALIWWLASQTSSPMMLSGAGLVAFLPNLFLGPFVGVWVDRMNRKTVMILADLSMGLAALGFAWFFIAGTPPYWSVGVVLFVRGVGGTFHQPAMQAAVSCMVPPEELVRANGWSQFLQSGAFMLGPVLGAAMYAALPMWLILTTDFIGALAAVFTLLAAKIPPPEKTAVRVIGFFHEMKAGAAYFLTDRRLLVLTIASTFSMVFFMPVSTFYPLMTSSYFSLSAWYGSVVEIVHSVGMMAAAMLAGLLAIKNKLAASHLGLFCVGVALVFTVFLPPTLGGFWCFALLCAVIGGAANFYNIPFVAYLQETIPQDAQGRVFSLFGTLMSFGMPVGLLIGGAFSERYGVPLWFTVSGAGVMLITAASYCIISRIKPHEGKA